MSRRDLLFEIGVEEIPSAALYDATVQMRADATKSLAEARLGYEDLKAFGAPRRLVLSVTGLAERQEDQTLRSRGPSVAAAFDGMGEPTKAAEGFARGKGVAVEDLVRAEEGGGEYMFAVIDRPGAPAADVLPELLARLAEGLAWPKTQRWGEGEARFIRPVRWLLALFGGEVVPVTFAGLTAGRVTYGHRFLSEGAIEVPSACEYALAAERGRFMYDQGRRATLVGQDIAVQAESVGGRAVTREKTLSEVINLVEWPSAAVGHFDEGFLAVPREVLETAMESHQRYFPLEAEDGSLMNAFVVVHNGDPDRGEAIVAGHERVIRARLADAAFFYHEDLKSSMEAWVARLESIAFHAKLGTLAAKVERIERLAERLASLSGADAGEAAIAARAAHLCKADLVSHAVVEFPTLQGVMGRYYALAQGEDPAVADAIVEHYRPRFAGDALPASTAGLIVSAADKLDTICGIFAIGAAPTGSADPYALRRGAIGVLTMLLDGGLALKLTDPIAAALDGFAGQLPGMDVQAVGSAVAEFLRGRLEGILKERGHAYDTVAAVLEVAADDPHDALARCGALTAVRDSETIADLSVAFARACNLGEPGLGTGYDRSIMGAQEAALADAMDGSEAQVLGALADRDYPAVLGLLAGLRGPIDAFFDAVLVMDPDPALRDNRLRLLNRFVALFIAFADFGKLAG